MDDLLTYAEASRLLNLKLGTLYALVSEGRIPHIRLGGRLVRFSRSALNEWLRDRAVGPAAGSAIREPGSVPGMTGGRTRRAVRELTIPESKPPSSAP